MKANASQEIAAHPAETSQAHTPQVQTPQAPAPQALSITVSHGPSQTLNLWWWAAHSDKPEQARPGVILLHGCGGMLNARGQPDQRFRSYAALLQAKGWHVLAPDSFSTRGVKEICTRERGSIAAVNQSLRRSDLAAAIAWLIDQAQVDKTRLALIGWSNGGSTVLEYTHRGDPQALKGQYPGLRAAAAFYPGCITREQQGYKPAMPVLLLVGLSDDWTSPEPCLKLASPLVQLRAWADAHHGFDGTAPLRFRTDIRNGTNPQGVHQGANAEAGRQARVALIDFLDQALSTSETDTSPISRY
ncbi:MAG: dienelactone hydrolase family protein [Proteobacteria bacterium]|nr:dienelactone hydrolase family protein [Pseudomonadota bacterium]